MKLFARTLRALVSAPLPVLMPLVLVGLLQVAASATKLFDDQAGDSAASPWLVPDFDPAAVDVQASTPDEQLALALAAAGSGDLARAAGRLEDLLAMDLDEETRGRAEREKERLAKLDALRRDALAFLQAQKKRVTIRFDGRAVNGMVAAIGDDEVTMEDHRGKKTAIALSSLDPGQLATIVKSKKIRTPEAWLPAYANLLSDKKDRVQLARNVLKKASGSAASSLSDDLASYDDLRAGAVDVEAMAAVFRLGKPDGAAAADKILAAIRAVAEAGNSTLSRYRDDLKRYAALSLARKFEADGVAALGLKGGVQLNGDDLIITYDLGDSRTLEDFDAADEYLRDFRGSYGALPDVTTSSREAGENGLRILGEGCLRHRLLLDAPMTVRVGFEYDYEESMTAGPIEVRIGLCDDGERNFIAVSNAGDLLIYDSKSGVKQVRSPLESIQTDLGYEFEIRHDGSRVAVRQGSEELTAESTGERTGGQVFLWYHTNVPTRLVLLEIEGKFAASRLDELRDAWLEKELERLFR